MKKAATQNVRVRVICEACIKEHDGECFLCFGHRYYFWDPETRLCYSALGELIEIADNTGQVFSVVRNHETSLKGTPDVVTMLDYIEIWASESPTRKWKLTCDDDGWQACVWFNRYKKSCFEVSGSSIETCIQKSYFKILESENSAN